MLGLPVPLASTLAQQPGSDDSQSQSGGSTTRFHVDAPASSGSRSLGVISETAPRFAPIPNPALPVLSEYGNASIYAFSNGSTRNAESVLAQRADELAKKFGEAKSDSERSQIKTELRELLEKHFSFRQKRHQEEIAGLEAKVKKLKELVDKRQENRREIIAKRLDQILSNAEGLGW